MLIKLLYKGVTFNERNIFIFSDKTIELYCYSWNSLILILVISRQLSSIWWFSFKDFTIFWLYNLLGHEEYFCIYLTVSKFLAKSFRWQNCTRKKSIRNVWVPEKPLTWIKWVEKKKSDLMTRKLVQEKWYLRCISLPWLRSPALHVVPQIILRVTPECSALNSPWKHTFEVWPSKHKQSRSRLKI